MALKADLCCRSNRRIYQAPVEDENSSEIRLHYLSPSPSKTEVNHRHKKKWRKHVGVILVSAHLLLTICLFGSFECLPGFRLFRPLELSMFCVSTFLAMMSFILMLKTLLMDPGEQPRLPSELQQQEAAFYNLNRKSSKGVFKEMTYFGEEVLGDYCFECRHFKDLRTVHCKYCNKCILRYDHHCTILGLTSQQAGKKNISKILMGVPTFWTSIISLLLLIVTGMGHIILFPCIYLYIIGKGKTAHELFYLVECKKGKCRIVLVEKEVIVPDPIKITALIDQRVKKNSCCSNFKVFLCSKTSPSLRDYDHTHTVFDVKSLDKSSKYPNSEKVLSDITGLEEYLEAEEYKSRCTKCRERCHRKCCNCCSKKNVATSKHRFDLGSVGSSLSLDE